MKTKSLLVAGLLALASPAFAQDAINVQGARVYDSPVNMMHWRQTCTITEVTFRVDGFPVNADCLEGRNRWPDVTPPGWTGPIQFTYGICLKAPDGQWECSAVVQAWYHRFIEHPEQTAAPYALNTDWFYDCSRWRGAMCSRNPLPGEQVGLFIVQGNARGGTEPTKVEERSNVALVTWGQNYVAAPGQPHQPTDPPIVVPGQPQQPSQPHPTDPVDMSDIRTLLKLTATYEQSERIFADLIRRDEEREKQIESLRAEINNPGWLTRGLAWLVKTPQGMAITAVLGTLVEERLRK